MFTGLVLESARCLSVEPASAGFRMVVVATHERFRSAKLGDSIAVNGACLTVVALKTTPTGLEIAFDVSEETRDRTNLAQLKAGDALHLEASLRLGDEMGGHIVTGHVDGVAQVGPFQPQGDYVLWEILLEGAARERVAPYLVEKGSIALDGVSLTVNAVIDEPGLTRVRMTLIPHTLQLTRFGALPPGAKVNVEADLLAKYAARALRFKP